MTASRQRVLTASLILIGIVIVGFFGLRTLHALREFREHRPPPPFAPDSAQLETDVELIRDWMTIPYIARTYSLPVKKLYEALEIPRKGNDEKSLAQLNEQYFRQAPGTVIKIVKAVILANQPQRSPESDETPIAPVTVIPPQP